MTRLAAIWTAIVFYLFMVGVTYGWMDATGWSGKDYFASADRTFGALFWPLFWLLRGAGMVGKAVAG